MSTFERISKAVDNIAGRLKELAKFIHEHPEIGFEEKLCSRAVADFLEKDGFRVERGIAGLETAFMASFGKVSGRPKVATLAEYDALPGLGHGCGHNLIAAVSCGAAVGVAKAFPDLQGEIRCVGTPAEEGGGGKVIMARKGIFDDMDAVLIAHPSNKTEVFKLALGVVQVKIEFFGKAAHAAAWPERGLNALDAMVLFFSGVNALRQQFPPHARVHGIITHGGDAPNIIPERTEAQMLVRALDSTVLDEMLEKVKSVAEGAAKSTGCRLEWAPDTENAYAPFHPNRVLGRIFRESIESIGVKVEQGREDEAMGSSDVGNVSERAPTIHPEFRIGPDNAVHHTLEFKAQAVTEEALDAMIKAAKAMALTASKIFEQPELADEIKKEFNKTRN